MGFNHLQESRAIDNLDDMTGIIKNELNNITEGFIAVGFYLKKTMKDGLYKQKGYANIFEYAQENFGISRPTAIRFMEINDKYSIGGFSPEIDAKWRGYGSSKLTEMLGLPEYLQEAIPVEATVKDIREAKTVIRETESHYDPQMELCDIAQETEEEPAAGWMQKLVKTIFEKKKEAFGEMVDWVRKEAGNDRRGIEEDILAIVNPTKFNMIRLDTANVMMTENGIRVMPYRGKGEQEEFSYIDFGRAFEELFYPDYPDISAPIQKVYEAVYGAPLYEKKPEKETAQKKEEPKKPAKPEKEKPKVSKQRIETKKPEEKKPEEKKPQEKPEESKEQEQIPGQTELTRDFPEYCPKEEPEKVPEVKGAYTIRRLYLASLSDEEAAAHMAAVMENKIRESKVIRLQMFTTPKFWEKIFTAEVDQEGREIECVS